MSDAYFTATHQFTELRALHELSTIAAEQEALAHGAVFKPSVFVRYSPFSKPHLGGKPRR